MLQSTLGNSGSKSKKNLLMSKKTFDAVEKKMSHIQVMMMMMMMMIVIMIMISRPAYPAAH